jgi:hypothetical protein
MSKLYIESIQELDTYFWAPDDQEVVVTMGLLRGLRPAPEPEPDAMAEHNALIERQLRSEELRREIDQADDAGRDPVRRLAALTQYEAEELADPQVWKQWEWREFGQSARWRPCTRPITWPRNYDFRRKP